MFKNQNYQKNILKIFIFKNIKNEVLILKKYLILEFHSTRLKTKHLKKYFRNWKNMKSIKYWLKDLLRYLTRVDTQLPQSCLGRQGPYFRSVEHFGRSSKAKSSKTPKIIINEPTNGPTNRLTKRVQSRVYATKNLGLKN